MDMSPLPHKVPVPFSLAQMLAAQQPAKAIEDEPVPTTTIVTPKIERKPLA
jgi:hypothetical protein